MMTYDELLAFFKDEMLKPSAKHKLRLKAMYDKPGVYQDQAMKIYEKYPVLGFRPFKAATYAFNGEVWVNSLLEGLNSRPQGVFAEVRQSDNKTGHFVGKRENGVYFCDCLDYKHNLKAIVVASGLPQQPCCHILSLIFVDPFIKSIFLG